MVTFNNFVASYITSKTLIISYKKNNIKNTTDYSWKTS